MRRINFPKTTLASLVVGFILIAGLVLRLRQYLSGRSLWLDEAMLALNIANRDFGGLLKPLDYDQGAPLGFLLLEKLVITLLGNGELTLRLLSVISGCLALLLFYLLLKRFLSLAGLLPALAFFAFSEVLVYYTSEVKQYIFDVFSLTALLLVFLTLTHRLAPDSSLHFRAFLPLLAAGTTAVWFSHPSVFVLAGIGLTLLWQNRHNGQTTRQLALVIAIWVVSFSLVFLASLNSLSANSFLMTYWQEYFMPMPPWSNPGWIFGSLAGTINYFVTAIPNWLALVLLLVGFITLLRTQPTLASVFALTLLAGYGASALGKYPMGGRMILFTAPISISLFGTAFDGLYQVFKRFKQISGWQASLLLSVLVVLVLFASMERSLERFITPRMQESVHPAMRVLRAKYQQHDTIYIYYGAMPSFRYYAPFYGFAEDQFMAGKTTYWRFLAPTLADIDNLMGNPRVWLMFSHVFEQGDFNELDAILSHIDEQKMGKCRLESREPGTSVLLYLCNFADHR